MRYLPNKTVNIKNVIVAFIYMVLLFAYSEIESIQYYYPSLFKNLGRIEFVSLFIVPLMALMFLQKEMRAKSKFVLLFILYSFWILLSTFINNAEILECFLYLSKLTCFLVLIAIFIKRNSKAFILITLIVLWLYALFNFVSIIQNPDGMYYAQMSDGSMNKWNWFLGYRNSFIRYYLPATFLGCIYHKLSHSWIFGLLNYFMIGLMIASLILANAATSYVGIILILIFDIIIEFILKRGTFLLKPITCFIANVFIFITLIVSNMINSWVAYFVVFVLNKSLTFSSRRNIWDLSIKSILEHPLFGVGYLNGRDVASIIGMQHSHNMYLWHAFQGGIPYLIIFLIILFFVLQSANACKTKNVSQISMFVLLIIMLMWQFEVFGNSIFIFSLLYIIYNIEKICDNIFSQNEIEIKRNQLKRHHRIRLLHKSK